MSLLQTFINTFTPATSNLVEANSEGADDASELQSVPASVHSDESTNSSNHSVEAEADPAISTAGHLSLIILFYAAVIMYFVFIILSWLQLPPTEANLIRPMTSLPPIALDVTADCTLGQCGNITFKNNYTFVDANADCKSQPDVINSIQPGTTRRVLLCSVPDTEMTTTISGDFTTYGFIVTFENFTSESIGEIIVKASEESSLAPSAVDTASFTGSRMQKALSVGGGMVKTFNMGVYFKTVDDTIDTLAPYAINYQMEGSRGGIATDVVLRLSPFANLKEIKNTRSILVMLGDLGSVTELVKLVFVLVIPIWGLVFANKANH